jgi:hydroxyacylglutathione hydrolase
MVFKTFVNSLHDSTCYLVTIGINHVIIIDPGSPNPAELIEYLKNEHLKISAVFLTHEHADHCAGVTPLFKYQPFPIFCSPDCAANIRNSKQNFSFYIDAIQAFEINLPVTPLTETSSLFINPQTGSIVQSPPTNNKLSEAKSRERSDSGHQTPNKLTLLPTPGHSPGSACIIIGNAIFTGDTILNDLKSPLTFPHSNRRQYAASIQKILSLLKPGMTIYPGHGEPYVFNSVADLII